MEPTIRTKAPDPGPDTDRKVAARLGIGYRWFSQNIHKALEAIQHLGEQEWDFCLSYTKEGQDMRWSATITSRLPLYDASKDQVLGHEQYEGEALTPALAICRAILDMPVRSEENDQKEAQQEGPEEPQGNLSNPAGEQQDPPRGP